MWKHSAARMPVRCFGCWRGNHLQACGTPLRETSSKEECPRTLRRGAYGPSRQGYDRGRRCRQSAAHSLDANWQASLGDHVGRRLRGARHGLHGLPGAHQAGVTVAELRFGSWRQVRGDHRAGRLEGNDRLVVSLGKPLVLRTPLGQRCSSDCLARAVLGAERFHLCEREDFPWHVHLGSSGHNDGPGLNSVCGPTPAPSLLSLGHGAASALKQDVCLHNFATFSPVRSFKVVLLCEPDVPMWIPWPMSLSRPPHPNFGLVPHWVDGCASFCRKSVVVPKKHIGGSGMLTTADERLVTTLLFLSAIWVLLWLAGRQSKQRGTSDSIQGLCTYCRRILWRLPVPTPPVRAPDPSVCRSLGAVTGRILVFGAGVMVIRPPLPFEPVWLEAQAASGLNFGLGLVTLCLWSLLAKQLGFLASGLGRLCALHGFLHPQLAPSVHPTNDAADLLPPSQHCACFAFGS